MKKFTTTNDDVLKSYCALLERYLKHDMQSDIDGNELFSELKVLKLVLPRKIKKAVEVLNFINSNYGELNFSNARTAYIIVFTIPVTIASTERSFFKSKIDQILLSIDNVPKKIEWINNAIY